MCCLLATAADEIDAWLDENVEKSGKTAGKADVEKPPVVREELRRMFQKHSRNPDRNVNIHANVLVISGDEGSGSGFKARIGDLPMIVSNAHVILKIRNPVIRDLQGRVYVPERIYASKTRDLVLIKYRYEDGNDTDLLNIMPLARHFKSGMPVTAYGNSLGSGVITEARGTMIGAGPERIEVTAGIVPGNSGGPVVCDATKEVIGIATSMQILGRRNELIGTRYESNYLKIAIRRFAVRLDNLSENDLEVLSFDDYKHDQKSSLAVDAFYHRADTIFSSSDNAAAKKKKLSSLCTRFVPVLKKIDAYVWKSSYLKQEYLRKRGEIDAFFKTMNVEDELLAAKIRGIWEKAEVKIKKIHIRGKTIRCTKCNGNGFLLEENRNRSEGFSRRLDDSVARRISCPVCHGARREKISNDIEGEQYVLSEDTRNALQMLIKPAKQPFNGFTVGGEMGKEYRRFDYYSRDRLLRRSPTPFGALLLYEGNHQIPNAILTGIRFSLGRLTQIVITIPDQGGNYHEAQQYVEENFSETDALYSVSVTRDRERIYIACVHKILPILLELPGTSGGEPEL